MTANEPDASLPLGAVLIIEDDPVLGTLLLHWMKRQGYLVNLAASAASARQFINSGERYDILVADCCLPDGYGPDLVALVRSLGMDPTVVVISGLQRTPVPRSVFLAKPFTLPGLMKAISTAREMQTGGGSPGVGPLLEAQRA